MSQEIATHFAQVYNTGIDLLSQQMLSETDGTMLVSNDRGERIYKDQIGSVRAQEKTTRFDDVPIVGHPHSRRAIDPRDFWLRDSIDSFDKLKVLNDPTNEYAMSQAAALAREADLLAVLAALGTAKTGKAGATDVTLPAGQIVDSGTTTVGFTLAKLKQAVRFLKNKHVIRKGMPAELHCYWTSFQEDEFSNTTEVKSIDYNTQRVLVQGGVDEFYKVNFHLLDDYEDNAAGRMLPYDGSTRQCVLWAKTGVRRNWWLRPQGFVDWLPEKQSFQVGAKMSVGHSRMEEVKVVRIDVAEN